MTLRREEGDPAEREEWLAGNRVRAAQHQPKDKRVIIALYFILNDLAILHMN